MPCSTAKPFASTARFGWRRDDMSSRRTPGPIRRGVSFFAVWSGLHVIRRPGVLGPGLRRDDKMKGPIRGLKTAIFGGNGMPTTATAAAMPTKPAFRKIEWLPRDIAVERRPDGVIVLSSRTPLKDYGTHIPQSLAKWAKERPDRVWLAQRGGADRQWRKVTY